MRTSPAPMPPTFEPGWITQYSTDGPVADVAR